MHANQENSENMAPPHHALQSRGIRSGAVPEQRYAGIGVRRGRHADGRDAFLRVMNAEAVNTWKVL